MEGGNILVGFFFPQAAIFLERREEVGRVEAEAKTKDEAKKINTPHIKLVTYRRCGED